MTDSTDVSANRLGDAPKIIPGEAPKIIPGEAPKIIVEAPTPEVPPSQEERADDRQRAQTAQAIFDEIKLDTLRRHAEDRDREAHRNRMSQRQEQGNQDQPSRDQQLRAQQARALRGEHEAHQLVSQTMQTYRQLGHIAAVATETSQRMTYAMLDVQHMMQRSWLDAMIAWRRQWLAQITTPRQINESR